MLNWHAGVASEGIWVMDIVHDGGVEPEGLEVRTKRLMKDNDNRRGSNVEDLSLDRETVRWEVEGAVLGSAEGQWIEGVKRVTGAEAVDMYTCSRWDPRFKTSRR